MKVFSLLVFLFALLAIATGLGDLFIGIEFQRPLGIGLNDNGFRDPVLNSQIHYLGAIWFGYGLFLLVCLRNVRQYRQWLQAAFWLVFLGGLGRLIAVWQTGMPDNTAGEQFVTVALVIELVGMPLLSLWLTRLTHLTGTSSNTPTTGA